MLKRDELAVLDEMSVQSADNEQIISALMLQLDKFNAVDVKVQRQLREVKRASGATRQSANNLRSNRVKGVTNPSKSPIRTQLTTGLNTRPNQSHNNANPKRPFGFKPSTSQTRTPQTRVS